MGKTSVKSVIKYQKKAYDRLNIAIPKGRLNDLSFYVKENGGSVNGLVNQLLQEKLGMSETEWKTRTSA